MKGALFVLRTGGKNSSVVIRFEILLRLFGFENFSGPSRNGPLVDEVRRGRGWGGGICLVPLQLSPRRALSFGPRDPETLDRGETSRPRNYDGKRRIA